MQLIDKIDASARESTEAVEAGSSDFILRLDSVLLHWYKHEGN